jgi:hypothetical protein
MGSRRRLPAHNLEPWRDQAVCRPGNGHDPRLWHPREPLEWATRQEQRAAQRIRHEMTEEARALCMTCPVRDECLDYALDTGETEGIWGGLTPEERGVTPLR